MSTVLDPDSADLTLLQDRQVAVLGFDVVWAEPDASSGMEVLDSLARGELRGNAGFQGAYADLRARLDFERSPGARMWSSATSIPTTWW